MVALSFCTTDFLRKLIWQNQSKLLKIWVSFKQQEKDSFTFVSPVIDFFRITRLQYFINYLLIFLASELLP